MASKMGGTANKRGYEYWLPKFCDLDCVVSNSLHVWPDFADIRPAGYVFHTHPEKYFPWYKNLLITP